MIRHRRVNGHVESFIGRESYKHGPGPRAFVDDEVLQPKEPQHVPFPITTERNRLMVEAKGNESGILERWSRVAGVSRVV